MRSNNWTKWLAIASAILAVILIVVGAIIFRQDLYEFSINPRSPFQVMVPPQAPNYAHPDSWASWPEPVEGAETAGADVFFVHTTTYFSANAWNAPIEGDAIKRVKDYLIPGQASVFEGIGQLYAPFYRQATLYTFFTRNLDSTRARMLAYSDLSAAFRHFLSARAADRPFFVVGHGQGAVHAVRLLSEYVAPDEEIRADFVAAYLVGATIPLHLFSGALSPLPPCRTAQQIGCIAAWTTFEDGHSPDEFFEHALYWNGDELLAAENEDILCINPLNWSMDERVANASKNDGAVPLVKDREKPLGTHIEHAVGAQCRNGILYVDRPPNGGFRSSILAGDRPNHLADLNLFYMNVKKNAEDRLTAFSEQRSQARKNGELY